MATADLIQGLPSGTPPERVGRFVLQSEIGRGRMGSVYKASDANNGQTVAVRIVQLNRFNAEPEVARLRLRNEARAASSLDCPNIVSVVGGGEVPELFYVTLEYISGTTLQQRLKNGEKIGVSEFLDIARQLCIGLEHAHSHKIFHGNLTPWNLIFELDGTMKIMDFGLARNLVATDTNDDSPSLPYQAPEVLRGGTADVRSDFFSAAAVLYEVLAGKKPFSGSTRAELIQNVMDGAAPPAHDSSISIHPGLSAVLAKALSKDPQDRYQRGSDFMRELENYKSLGAKPAPVVVERFPAPAPFVAQKAPTPPPMAAPKPVAETVRIQVKPAPVAAMPSPKPTQVSRPVASAANPKRNVMLAVALVVIAGLVFALWKTRARDAGPTPSITPAVSQPAEEAPATTAAPAAPVAPRTAPRRVTPAPVAAPAAPATGDLMVSANPEGVGAQIDGGTSFMAPFTQPGMTAGPHTIVFSKPGYVSETRKIEVVAGGKAMVAVTLQPQGAWVTVNSQPAGAAILVDGKEMGTTPAKLTLSDGQHAIAVRKDGYLPQSTTQALARGQQFLFSPELMPAGSTAEIKTVGKFKKMFGGSGQEMGMVEVKSMPKGAEITVNGQKVPKLAPTSFMLNPGNYELELRMDGYRPVKRVITVNKGEQVKVEEQLLK